MLKLNIKQIVLILIVSGCIEPFDPPEINRSIDFLVVGGFLNSTEGSINVRLTHARDLNSEESFRSEENAQVILESKTGTVAALVETGQGNYFQGGMVIDPGTSYRLKIKTILGSEYISEFVEVILTPPIDSVTYRFSEDGVDILVNTHDDSNKTRYYQWRFTETWQYNSPQQSNYKYINGSAILREFDEQIFTCYSNEFSTKILVHSSNRLGSDIIRDFSVNFLPAGSRKLSNKYSILVQQSGISQEAYEFWSLLQQTTENIGGLFDPQPGKVIGNMKSVTNPSEPVLGIFQAGSVTEQRIFISSLDLPDHLRYNTVRQECRPDSVEIAALPNFSDISHHLVNAIYEGLTVVGYTYAPKTCTDCRFEGGTLTKPDFWE